jgi:hypothetical protein
MGCTNENGGALFRRMPAIKNGTVPENIGGSSFFLIKGVCFKTVYGILGIDTRNLPGGQILPGALLMKNKDVGCPPEESNRDSV